MSRTEFKRWIAGLSGGEKRRFHRGTRSRGVKLTAEQLESRDVPTTFTWLPTAPGAYNWNDSSNWSGGSGYPNATGDVANLATALTGNETISLNQAITVGTIDMGSTGTSGTFTIVANSGSLTLHASSGSAVLDDQNNGGDSINSPITLASNLALTSGGTTPLAIGGAITGSGTITTTGTIEQTTQAAFGSGVTLSGTGTIAPTPVLYVVSFYDGGLYEFNEDTGAVLATLVAPNSSPLLELPDGITVGPDGNLYIGCQDTSGGPTFNDSILEYNLTTQSLSTFIDSSTLDGIAGLTVNGGNTVFDPAGLAFGPDGNLYASLNGGIDSGAGAVVEFGITDNSGVLSYSGTNSTVAPASAGLV